MKTLKTLAEANNWRILDKRWQKPTQNRTERYSHLGLVVTTVVEFEQVKLLPNGNPIPTGTEGQTDAIRRLASLGKAADEADEENRDFGWELYELHELNGGRESLYDEFRGCTHSEIIDVADGHKGRITTGNTLVWSFCTDCGSIVGDSPQDYWSVLCIGLQHCTRTEVKDHPYGSPEQDVRVEKWTEVVWWEVYGHPYIEPELYTVKEATPLIRRAIKRR